MGMFDDIRVKYKGLPLPEDTKGLPDHHFNSVVDYQTKSLDNVMDRYELREDASLWVRRSEVEYVSGDPKGDTFSKRFGHMKTIKEWWEPSNHTGSVVFYNSLPEDGTRDNFESDYWIEYNAKFINGKLDRIELEQFEASPNAERKHSDSVWKRDDELRHEFHKTKFNKYFYRYYISAVHTVFFRTHRLLSIVASTGQQLCFKIENFLDFVGKRRDDQSGVTSMKNKRKEKYGY